MTPAVKEIGYCIYTLSVVWVARAVPKPSCVLLDPARTTRTKCPCFGRMPICHPLFPSPRVDLREREEPDFLIIEAESGGGFDCLQNGGGGGLVRVSIGSLDGSCRQRPRMTPPEPLCSRGLWHASGPRNDLAQEYSQKGRFGKDRGVKRALPEARALQPCGPGSSDSQTHPNRRLAVFFF